MVIQMMGLELSHSQMQDLAKQFSTTYVSKPQNRFDTEHFKKLKAIFEEVPEKAKCEQKAIAKWQELGPIPLEEWILTGKVKYDPEVPIL